MLKTAEPQDPNANAEKAKLDSKAAGLLGFDPDEVRKAAIVLAMTLPEGACVVVTGGAGSGKTTIARELAKTLGAKNFDFDEYIPGGYTADKTEYARRFSKGLYELWEDVPEKKAWVIEHVEACSPDLVGLYRPDYALLVDPGVERIAKAAVARSMAGDSKPEERVARGLQSAEKAKKQFNALPGEMVETGLKGFLLKELSEG